MVLAASPDFRLLAGRDMALIHCCTCEGRICRIGTSANVTDAAACWAASIVPRSQTWRLDHCSNQALKVIFPASGST
jgi:hypothetical protein